MTYRDTVWILLTDASGLGFASFERVFLLENASSTLSLVGSLLGLVVSYDDLLVVFWLMVGHGGFVWMWKRRDRAFCF